MKNLDRKYIFLIKNHHHLQIAETFDPGKLRCTYFPLPLPFFCILIHHHSGLNSFFLSYVGKGRISYDGNLLSSSSFLHCFLWFSLFFSLKIALSAFQMPFPKKKTAKYKALAYFFLCCVLFYSIKSAFTHQKC